MYQAARVAAASFSLALFLSNAAGEVASTVADMPGARLRQGLYMAYLARVVGEERVSEVLEGEVLECEALMGEVSTARRFLSLWSVATLVICVGCEVAVCCCAACC